LNESEFSIDLNIYFYLHDKISFLVNFNAELEVRVNVPKILIQKSK